MIRAVLDTNTLVSGIGWAGVPGQILDAAAAGKFRIVASPELLSELHRVLHYPKLRVVIEDPDQVIGLVSLIADVVEPTERLTLVTDDADNRVIEAALAGKADVVVTGDSDLLRPGGFGPVRVCTPRDFLAVL